VYASGELTANTFTYSNISVAKCFGTNLGYSIAYQGWVDNVEFHWSEDGIPGCENSVTYNFDTTQEGFAHTDDQTYSEVTWDSGNGTIDFTSDRRDPDSSAERYEKPLPYAITESNW
jgi:hypothetical protein